MNYDNPTNESAYNFRVFQSGCRFFNETSDSWDTGGLTVCVDVLHSQSRISSCSSWFIDLPILYEW